MCYLTEGVLWAQIIFCSHLWHLDIINQCYVTTISVNNVALGEEGWHGWLADKSQIDFYAIIPIIVAVSSRYCTHEAQSRYTGGKNFSTRSSYSG